MLGLPKRLTLLSCLISVVGIALVQPGWAGPPSILKIFGDSKSIDQADSFILAEEDGPWLILATTFVGENAKQRAERTAVEIRKALRLPAFIYKEQFNFTKSDVSRTSNVRKVRYANPHQYEAYAVLVGEYDSVEHESIEKDLERLKKADLPVFRDENELRAEYNTDSPASMIKTFGQQIFKSRKGRNRSPLATAFVTRNPMLPDTYFEQPTVDSFVQRLNEDKEFSLLECNGKFTVIVRTFDSCGTFVGSKNQNEFAPSAERLLKFAAQADLMVRKLREQGEEAYQFHDRTRSVVTIGSFDSLGHELPDGRFQYAPEIRRVMREFTALNTNRTRKIPGVDGVAAHHVAMIPFDVQPTPIAVPKASKKSLYQAAFRRR